MLIGVLFPRGIGARKCFVFPGQKTGFLHMGSTPWQGSQELLPEGDERLGSQCKKSYCDNLRGLLARPLLRKYEEYRYSTNCSCVIVSFAHWSN